MGDQGQCVTLWGKRLVCAHCGGDRFWRRSAQLNTALLTFLDLEWLNRTATVFVCTARGRLEWFLDPSMAPLDDTVEPSQCVSCGATIPPGQDMCVECGWTYKE